MISALLPNYARFDIAFERGEGVYLIAEGGERYLDFGAGIAVNALGHGHPHLVAALTEQAGKLWHTSNLYRIPGQEKLAERLVASSFADAVFFCNSGAEAWEAGLKMARRYHDRQGAAHKKRMITATAGFHGRTMAGISSSAQAKMTDGFGPLLEGFDPVPFGNGNALRAAVTDETAAICIEPILGEGGIQAGSERYLRDIRAVADEFDLLVFLDEVQTGFGRTGKLFAHEWAGITPDIMCIAKGMGGGFPVGAVLTTERVATVMTPGSHGTTFGGNPLAMAVANAVLDIVGEPDFLASVQRKGAHFAGRLEALAREFPAAIREVRGIGLMRGLQLQSDFAALDMVKALNARGLLTVGAADNVIRLMPPLIIDEAEIDQGCGIIASALAELQTSAPAEAANA